MVKRILKIPSDVEVEALFPIGYAKQGKGTKKRRKDVNIDNILFFEEYKNKKMNPPKRVEA